VIWVPGSFEIPVVAQQLALSEKYHAVTACEKLGGAGELKCQELKSKAIVEGCARVEAEALRGVAGYGPGIWGGVVVLGLADDGVLAGDKGVAARGNDLVPVGVRVAQDVEEKRVVADLRPEKPAFTDLALREVGADDAAALKATGATTEEATADAIAAEMLEWSLTQQIQKARWLCNWSCKRFFQNLWWVELLVSDTW
jgi:hypothetical protein